MTTRMIRHLVLGAFALAPAAAFADHDGDCDHPRSEVYPAPSEQGTYSYPEAYPTYNSYPTSTVQTYPAQTYPAQTYPAQTYPAQVDYAYPTAAPPAPLVERVYPRRGFVWVPGYYTWSYGQYAWTNGHWERDRPGYRYVSGRWDRHGNRYGWVAPTWYREPVRYRAGLNWSPGRYEWRNGVQVWVGGSFNSRRHHNWR